MDHYKRIKTPLTEKEIKLLKPGDEVLLTGTIYTGRDKVHQRLARLIEKEKKLPFNLAGQVIYYTGPTPTPPGKIIGSCGPTTSIRMDPFTPILLEMGLKGMIGKGRRSKIVRKAIKRYKAVYFVTFGGCGALLSKFVKKAELFAYAEFGPEAIYKLEVEDFPLIVALGGAK